MRISNIRHQVLADGKDEVSADVALRKPRPQTHRIWFRGPAGCFGAGPLGDMFFAAFWVPAMFLQEEFEIDGEVSSELLDTAYENLEPVFLRWFRQDLRPARVQNACIIEEPAPAAPGCVCMFSGGLDSTYTLFRHRDSVTHLAYVHGFDVSWEREDLAGRAAGELREIAQSLGKEHVVLHSNFSDALAPIVMGSGVLGRHRPTVMVDMFFGSAIVAFNLCLRGFAGRSLIASSWSYEHIEPRGSHPLIEPSWSTSKLKVELDGCEADRIDKVAWLLQHAPEAFAGLRVCVHPPKDGAANCGRCSKCLRTMMEMKVAGASAGHFVAFQQPFDARAAMCAQYKIENGFIQDVYEKARSAHNKEMTEITGVILGKRFYAPRLRKRLKARFREWMGIRPGGRVRQGRRKSGSTRMKVGRGSPT